MGKHRRGLGFGQSTAVEEEPIGIGGQIAPGRELCDRHASQSKETQGMLATLGKESVSIADAHDADGVMFPLLARDANEHLEFSRPLADRISRRPRRRPNYGDSSVGAIGAI